MEIEKGIEDEILKELSNSETFWTDLYTFMEKSKYSFNDFYKVLKELVEEDVIKTENKQNLPKLNLIAKGKLWSENGYSFKLNKRGYLDIENSKLQKESFEYQKTIRSQSVKISNLTTDNLRLNNLDIRFRWYISIGSFLVGIITKFLLDK
jgi:hypothetical protein